MSGVITIEMVKKAKGKVLMLPKQINQSTGKVSHQLMGFKVTWCKCYKSYMALAKKLSEAQFDQVVRLATEFMKINTCLVDDNDDVIEIGDKEDICTNVINRPSSSEDEAERKC